MAHILTANEQEFMDLMIEEVIVAAEEVAATLGPGFDREVYRRALSHELGLRGRSVKAQPSCTVLYKGAVVSGYSVDLIVSGRLAVELDCGRERAGEQMVRCRKYMAAAGMQLGLVLRFRGTKVEWEPVVNQEVRSFAA